MQHTFLLSLAGVLKSLPQEILKFGRLTWLVIDNQNGPDNNQLARRRIALFANLAGPSKPDDASRSVECLVYYRVTLLVLEP